MNTVLARGRWLLIVAAGVAAACSDAAGPARPTPRFGVAAAGTTGITLDQFSGIADDPEAWGQGETHVGKNFVANPHLGDAIVATFFWRGTSNTIIQVTDHLCDVNNTPVGNTYVLEDYVTQGGYSMATYVATNAQNFPVPAPTSDQLLCVHAIFSNTLSEAGMIISAYQGVDPNSATALGAHRAASGTASTTSPEGPGAIAVGSGAMAYAVTVSAPIGTDPPAGFTDIAEDDDNVDKADAEYVVLPSGGTANPTWNWYFTSSQAWVAEVLALNPAGGSGSTNQPPTAAFSSSCSGLICAFTNSSSDPDGSIASSAWTFGDGGTSTAQSPSYTYAAGGTYTVTLTVTDNQGATSSVSHSVTVSGGNQSPVASFTSSCSGLTCSFTSTSSDPDGTISAYSWNFGDGGTSTAQDPTHTYAVGGTTYTVTLTVTDNQGATGSVTQSRHVRRR